MIRTDFLFSRQSIIGKNAAVKANSLLHLDGMEEDGTESFLATLFSDLALVDIIKPQPIFMHTKCAEVGNIPAPPASFNFVLFFDAKTLMNEEWQSHLTDLHLQGYQLGLRNPSLAFLNRLSVNPFMYVEFSLIAPLSKDIINLSNHPAINQKQMWFSNITNRDNFKLIRDNTPAVLFSGPFISEPAPVKGRKIPTYRLILSTLLVRLQSPDASLKSLAECIEKDPTLTYRIINLTKSVLYYRQFNVNNVQRAIEIIGFKDLIKWVSLAIFNSIDGKPDYLFSMAVHRACFCDAIAKKLYPKEEGAFLTGLFSYLPSFFDEPLESLLSDLPISNEIMLALLEKKGDLGNLLTLAIHYENGRWNHILFDKLAYRGVTKRVLRELYIDSLKDAKEIYSK